jgi:hypothetical protein
MAALAASFAAERFGCAFAAVFAAGPFSLFRPALLSRAPRSKADSLQFVEGRPSEVPLAVYFRRQHQGVLDWSQQADDLEVAPSRTLSLHRPQ